MTAYVLNAQERLRNLQSLPCPHCRTEGFANSVLSWQYEKAMLACAQGHSYTNAYALIDAVRVAWNCPLKAPKGIGRSISPARYVPDNALVNHRTASREASRKKREQAKIKKEALCRP